MYDVIVQKKKQGNTYIYVLQLINTNVEHLRNKVVRNNK